MSLLDVTVGDGKHQVIADSDGDVEVLLHGEPWRGFVADAADVIFTLGQEVEALRGNNQSLEHKCSSYQSDIDELKHQVTRMQEYVLKLKEINVNIAGGIANQ